MQWGKWVFTRQRLKRRPVEREEFEAQLEKLATLGSQQATEIVRDGLAGGRRSLPFPQKSKDATKPQTNAARYDPARDYNLSRFHAPPGKYAGVGITLGEEPERELVPLSEVAATVREAMRDDPDERKPINPAIIARTMRGEPAPEPQASTLPHDSALI